MTNELLKAEILKLSESKVWHEAKTEWSLDHIQVSHYPKTCLCGTGPTNELFHLYNAWTAEKATVGNCCISLFFGAKAKDLFKSLQSIKNTPYYAPDKNLADFVVSHKWVNDWEEGFMRNTKQLKTLTEHQLMQRARINAKISRRAWKR